MRSHEIRPVPDDKNKDEEKFVCNRCGATGEELENDDCPVEGM